MIHVFELDVLRHLLVSIWKEPERIQSAGRAVTNLRTGRHSNPKQQLIYLDAKLETHACLVSLWPNESVSVYCRKHFCQRRCNSRHLGFRDIHPHAMRRSPLCDFIRELRRESLVSRQRVGSGQSGFRHPSGEAFSVSS